jgi:hypothetical protein
MGERKFEIPGDGCEGTHREGRARHEPEASGISPRPDASTRDGKGRTWGAEVTRSAERGAAERGGAERGAGSAEARSAERAGAERAARRRGARSGQARSGQARSGQARSGQARRRGARSGQARSGQRGGAERGAGSAERAARSGQPRVPPRCCAASAAERRGSAIPGSATSALLWPALPRVGRLVIPLCCVVLRRFVRGAAWVGSMRGEAPWAGQGGAHRATRPAQGRAAGVRTAAAPARACRTAWQNRQSGCGEGAASQGISRIDHRQASIRRTSSPACQPIPHVRTHRASSSREVRSSSFTTRYARPSA